MPALVRRRGGADVRTLRLLIAVLALPVLVAGDPLSYVSYGPFGVFILLLGFGAIAADSLPLQRVPLVCSTLTVPLALFLIVEPWRPVPLEVIAASILLLQAVGWWAARRGTAAQASTP